MRAHPATYAFSATHVSTCVHHNWSRPQAWRDTLALAAKPETALLMLNKAEAARQEREPVVIKKYANRRLYNTETSTYVTLEDLATHGAVGPRFRGLRRQERRGADPRRPDPDHRRAGGPVGRADAVAHAVPASAHPLLRRRNRADGAELPAVQHGEPSQGAGPLREQFANPFSAAGAFEAISSRPARISRCSSRR